MKKLLNTLYVTTQGAYLHQDGENVVIEVERQERLRLPIHNLEGIICFGNVIFSPYLLGLCGQRGVNVSLLTEHGRFLARVQGPISGNILLRCEQHRRAESSQKSMDIARNIVLGKILNCRNVLLRAGREADDAEKVTMLDPVLKRLGRIARELGDIDDLDVLRGAEGEAGRLYYSVFDFLIKTEKEHFFMKERTRRPPRDNLNSLLSFIYTLLTHDAVGACEGVGLDPQRGFLHALRPGRPSLALDLVEEFRSVIADRLAVSLINLRQVSPKGFRQTESDAVEMDEETRKTIIVAYQKRKQEVIQHPFLKETMPIGLLLHTQALLLARYLRGDLDAYPPFIWR